MIQSSDLEAQKTGLKHTREFSGDPSAPLLLLVHGRAGDFNAMWTFRRCAPQEINVIAPQAPLPDPLGGFSWWDISKERGMSEGTVRARDTLLSFIGASISHYQLNPSAIIALGFSQGAGLLSLVLQCNPLLFSGVGLLAGFVIRDEKQKDSIKALTRHPAIFIAHGSKDEYVPIELSKKGIEYLKELGFSPEVHIDDVGHKVGANGMRELKKWIGTLI